MPELLSIDAELASRADALFRELGLDLSTAVQLFLLQSLREHGLPFTPRLTPPSAAPRDAAPASSRQEEDVPCASAPEASPMERAEEKDAEKAAPVSCRPEEERSEDARLLSDGEDDGAADDDEKSARPFTAPSAAAEEDAPSHEEGGELRQAFINAGLIGAPLRRVRSLNRLYSIGEPNPQVKGWREVYVSGDEPFALDFGIIRVELGFHGGGSLRMMDGRLPDSVLEADAVYPRDLSAVFSSVIGQRLADVSSARLQSEGQTREQLCLRFANGCTLNFAPGGEWGALWLTDAHGAVMFAPEAVWLRVLDDRTGKGLR